MRSIAPRLQMIGRIRIGHRVPTESGKTRPDKLTNFRLTSASEVALQQAASLYGGSVTVWENAPTEGQFELYTTSNTLQVILPGLDAWQTSYERRDLSGLCLRRCTGQFITFDVLDDSLQGLECQCSDVQEDACEMVGRLSVILQGVQGIGVWRLDTGSTNAASEIPGLMAQLQMLGITRPLQCILRIESRESTVLVPETAYHRRRKVQAYAPGKVRETRHYIVPILTPLHDYAQLATLAGEQRLLPNSTDEVIARGRQAAADLYGGGLDGPLSPSPHEEDEARHEVLAWLHTALVAERSEAEVTAWYNEFAGMQGRPVDEESVEMLRAVLRDVQRDNDRRATEAATRECLADILALLKHKLTHPDAYVAKLVEQDGPLETWDMARLCKLQASIEAWPEKTSVAPDAAAISSYADMILGHMRAIGMSAEEQAYYLEDQEKASGLPMAQRAEDDLEKLWRVVQTWTVRTPVDDAAQQDALPF